MRNLKPRKALYIAYIFQLYVVVLRNKVFIEKQPPDVFYEKGILKNSSKFAGKHLCQSLFFNKVARLSPATLLKKRFWHMSFPVNLRNFKEHLFLQNTSGRILLFICVK